MLSFKDYKTVYNNPYVLVNEMDEHELDKIRRFINNPKSLGFSNLFGENLRTSYSLSSVTEDIKSFLDKEGFVIDDDASVYTKKDTAKKNKTKIGRVGNRLLTKYQKILNKDTKKLKESVEPILNFADNYDFSTYGKIIKTFDDYLSILPKVYKHKSGSDFPSPSDLYLYTLPDYITNNKEFLIKMLEIYKDKLSIRPYYTNDHVKVTKEQINDGMNLNEMYLVIKDLDDDSCLKGIVSYPGSYNSEVRKVVAMASVRDASSNQSSSTEIDPFIKIHELYNVYIQELKSFMTPEKKEALEAIDFINKHFLNFNNYEVIVSRSPIDVIRMSDFKNIESCHSKGGSYFKCAITEAQDTGLVAYLVVDSEFKKIKNLQATEIFKDSDRSVDGISPILRARLRRVVSEGKSFAIPEFSIYGSSHSEDINDLFRESVKTWARDNQKELYDASPDDIENIVSKMGYMGGTYTDSSIINLVKTFFETRPDYEDDIKSLIRGKNIPYVGSEPNFRRDIERQIADSVSEFRENFEDPDTNLYISAYADIDEDEDEDAEYNISTIVKYGIDITSQSLVDNMDLFVVKNGYYITDSRRTELMLKQHFSYNIIELLNEKFFSEDSEDEYSITVDAISQPQTSTVPCKLFIQFKYSYDFSDVDSFDSFLLSRQNAFLQIERSKKEIEVIVENYLNSAVKNKHNKLSIKNYLNMVKFDHFDFDLRDSSLEITTKTDKSEPLSDDFSAEHSWILLSNSKKLNTRAISNMSRYSPITVGVNNLYSNSKSDYLDIEGWSTGKKPVYNKTDTTTGLFRGFAYKVLFDSFIKPQIDLHSVQFKHNDHPDLLRPTRPKVDLYSKTKELIDTVGINEDDKYLQTIIPSIQVCVIHNRLDMDSVDSNFHFVPGKRWNQLKDVEVLLAINASFEIYNYSYTTIKNFINTLLDIDKNYDAFVRNLRKDFEKATAKIKAIDVPYVEITGLSVSVYQPNGYGRSDEPITKITRDQSGVILHLKNGDQMVLHENDGGPALSLEFSLVNHDGNVDSAYKSLSIGRCVMLEIGSTSNMEKYFIINNKVKKMLGEYTFTNTTINNLFGRYSSLLYWFDSYREDKERSIFYS